MASLTADGLILKGLSSMRNLLACRGRRVTEYILCLHRSAGYFMTEFAAAGTVAGLISLSISCCAGLANYYSDFNSCSDELNYMVISLEELRSLCQTIDSQLQGRNQVQEPTAQVVRLIAQCRDKVQELDVTLFECRKTKLSQDTTTKMTLFQAKALYPFKKKTLQRLKETVDDVHKNLGSALQILQM